VIPRRPRPAVAAVVFCQDAHGRVLAVSRKGSPDDLGLPGGKVEPGESPAEAARRELREETGLLARGLRPLYAGTVGVSLVHCFAARGEGEIHTAEAGRVAWLDDPEPLTRGSFGGYNAAVLKAARRGGLL
jgi:8-oxo-dGTP pyrophosphatase MutT (NUDIX family)